MKEKLVLIDGYYFSVGTSIPEDKGYSSSIAAEKSSDSNAVHNSYKLIAAKIKWPAFINKKLYENVLGEYEKFNKLRIADSQKSLSDFDKAIKQIESKKKK